MTPTTSTTAGRLITPPSPGGLAIEPGSATPKTESSRSLTYPPQPTATVATENPYSISRSQPMIHAMISPSVA
jgi:hypothetical protein